MKRYTHIIVGFSLGFMLGNTFIESVTYALISSLGAEVPDKDLRLFGGRFHRQLFHNIFIPLILVTALPVMALTTNFPLSSKVVKLSTVFALGLLSHILLDSITFRGVAFFFPLSRKTYGVRAVASNNTVANVFISGLFILLMLARLVEKCYLCSTTTLSG